MSPLRIDVVSDVVCPWCHIGRAQLDAAVARWRAAHPRAPAPRIAWHPFQLNPQMPATGMPRGDYLDAKFGSRSAYPAARLERAAAQAGVALALDAIARQPSTLRAHALLRAAGEPAQATEAADDTAADRSEPVAGAVAMAGTRAGAAHDAAAAGRADGGSLAGRQHALAGALFHAYFAAGEDVGDEAVLRRLGREAGLDEARIDQAFGEASLAATAAADERMRQARLGGVPFFVIDGRVAVSGAQGPEALLEAMERAAAARET